MYLLKFIIFCALIKNTSFNNNNIPDTHYSENKGTTRLNNGSWLNSSLLEVCVVILGTKSNIYFNDSESLYVYFWLFPLASFRMKIPIIQRLVCGRNVLGRNGCLTKNPEGTQKDREQNDLCDSSLSEWWNYAVIATESNKLTDNCSHLRIAQVEQFHFSQF